MTGKESDATGTAVPEDSNEVGDLYLSQIWQCLMSSQTSLWWWRDEFYICKQGHAGCSISSLESMLTADLKEKDAHMTELTSKKCDDIMGVIPMQSTYVHEINHWWADPDL